jgi:hypothetical protein
MVPAESDLSAVEATVVAPPEASLFGLSCKYMVPKDWGR